MIKDELIALFRNAPSGPFLFLGSGFSRRYLELEDWEGLLTRYCEMGKPFQYYLTMANGSLPAAASLIAAEFNRHYWSEEKYAASRERFKSKLRDATSALRLEIAGYLSTLDQSKAKTSKYGNEVALLSDLSVDGIITTNWDLFIEQLFPEYRPFIGQKELLFSNPQQIAEIYKIHGCASKPESLVLTNEDYIDFNARNPYLAAKLITLFVEHPIIFIGYRLSDPNIQGILRAIASCIGSDNIEKLRKNLIFVQRPREAQGEGLSHTAVTIDGVQIPIVSVVTNDFCQIYEAIQTVKRKIPARVLRYCKEQLYEVVKSVTPTDKIYVSSIDEIGKSQDVEFVVGLGVARKNAGDEGIAEKGYSHITLLNLLTDVIHDNGGLDSEQVVSRVIPLAGRNTPNVPVFKYLRNVGINSLDDYKNSDYELDKWVLRDLKDFRMKSVAKLFFKHRHLSIEELIAACTPENAAIFIPLLAKDKIDLAVLYKFIVEHEEKIDAKKSVYSSNFRKLIVLYDRLKWGW
ncbi:SIR2 family protein [Massilia sp. CFBP9026]|uniref:SIR2 family protein n=1 Tax=Massilia sp. CFBP9026 TaxID=3096536 RepID=UPI002A6AE9CD|nr:SIR2 family protein [Massilia sp. CFBP9026]MDY0964882.1 SIR2 family protein [Massilia sp. CFBP9026]